MIKIEQVAPLNQNLLIRLEDISNDYFDQAIKGLHVKRKLQDARNNHGGIRRKFGLSGRLWSAQYNDFIDYLTHDDHWERMFYGHISILFSDFLRTSDCLLLHDGTNQTSFGKLIESCFNFKGFRNHTKRGKWLAGRLNIKTCPYCNANYTLAINEKNEGIRDFKGLFQFDHFFPRSRAPHLSFSLYNLIPSCANCNLIKSKEATSLKTHYHPYYNDLSLLSQFKFWYNGEYTKPEDIELEELHVRFKSKYRSTNEIVENHNDMYRIDAVYERHKDVVKDLMVKSVLYGSKYKEQLLEIKGLFNRDERLYRRYLLGNYGFEDEITKRPLVKLTRDIAIDLKLIED